MILILVIAGTPMQVTEPATAMAWDRRGVEEVIGDWSHQAPFA
jgi:hypothetical protein